MLMSVIKIIWSWYNNVVAGHYENSIKLCHLIGFKLGWFFFMATIILDGIQGLGILSSGPKKLFD